MVIELVDSRLSRGLMKNHTEWSCRIPRTRVYDSAQFSLPVGIEARIRAVSTRLVIETSASDRRAVLVSSLNLTICSQKVLQTIARRFNFLSIQLRQHSQISTSSLVLTFVSFADSAGAIVSTLVL